MVPGSPSVAVRIYAIDEIRRLEVCSSQSSQREIDVDGLQNFRDSFEFSVVIFVLPNGEVMRDQLGRRESFVNLAQKALLAGDKVGEVNCCDTISIYPASAHLFCLSLHRNERQGH